MNRRHALLMLAALPLAAQSQSLKDMASSMKDPLLGMLTSQLGVTDNQAQGGVGSLVDVGQGKVAGRRLHQGRERGARLC